MMMKKLLEVHFGYDATNKELAKGVKEIVEPISKVNGLVWKIFIINFDEELTGGIYLFENEEDAKVYMEGPVFEKLKNIPGLNNFEVKMFDIMGEESKVTRAPI